VKAPADTGRPCFITKHALRLQDRDSAKDLCLLIGGGLPPRV
jgi:hypothetical protein